MKTELSALDLHFLLKELATALIGARVDKIYQPDGFFFQLHKSGEGKLLLKIEKNCLWLTGAKTDMPETQKGMCQLLRKVLEGKKLISLEQVNGERILKLTFATQAEQFILYVELFSTGNLILCDFDGTIKMAVEERAWKDRQIKRGEPYQLPPSKKNTLTFERADFTFGEYPISKQLAQLGLGKTYAMELCARAGVAPLAETIDSAQADKLFLAYKTILFEPISARAYVNGEIAPIELKHLTETFTQYSSFSEALDKHLGITASQQRLDKKRQKFLAEKERIQHAIDMQQKNLEKAELEIVQNQRAGELIYEHYQELQEIIEELRKAKEKFSLHQMKEKLKGHPTIKDIDPKTSDVVIEIDT
ncbi:NFACT family protein [Candidatus Woesearchaeota archaeon]|nr:NFACT family protein [Candidatus Woesearchaeota archaeon]